MSLAAAVRARGGRWCNVSEEVQALVPADPPSSTSALFIASLAAALERGAFPGFAPAGEFQARASGCDVWVRHRR